MRLIMSAALLLALSGCDAMQTAMNQNGDVASGGVEQRNAEAQARQDRERERTESLQQQLADLQSQQDSLQAQLSITGGQLHEVRMMLAREKAATHEQRQEYKDLLAKQKALQQKVAAAKSAPPPANREDALDQKQDLAKLTQEKADLEKQVDGLKHAL